MKRLIWIAALAVALFSTLAVVETLKSDEPFSATGLALDLFEAGVLALAVVATAFASLEIRDMRRERIDLLNDLARARVEGERWRTTARVHLDGLSRAILEQFRAWRLSEGEADVAVLMLKGLSHKEIARLREAGEATVRQQAASVYRKSGLASRAELAAFFLEDLFAPDSERGATPARAMRLVDSRD
ncbi:MAG: LuxR C-terminal-related transcriptional regulator [Cucumibacter sp.]